MARRRPKGPKAKPRKTNGNNNPNRGRMAPVTVVQRSIVGRGLGQPVMKTIPGGLSFLNTEAFTPVVTSGTAGSPACASTSVCPFNFAWLNGVASSFSKYRWKRLRFTYVTQVSTSIDGRVAMNLTYDQKDSAPATLAQVIAGYKSTFGPAWAGGDGMISNSFENRAGSVHLDVDTSRLDKRYYPYITLSGYNGLTSPDGNIYCGVFLDYGSDGSSSTSKTLGTIYATYEVELIEPIAPALQ